MSTYTSTYTRTHTAAYLADVVMGSIGDVLAHLGIDLTRLYRNWTLDENAIKAWIEEEALEQVILECEQPNGRVSPIIEFPITYKASGAGDAEFTSSRAALARYRGKLDSVPRGTTFRLVCTYRKTPSEQPGWGSTTRASIDGLSSMSFGTLASAPHASASMRYHR